MEKLSMYNIILTIHISSFALTLSGLALNLLGSGPACNITNIKGLYRCGTSAFLLAGTGFFLSLPYSKTSIPTWIIVKFLVWAALFVLSAWASVKLTKNRKIFFYFLFLIVVFESFLGITKTI